GDGQHQARGHRAQRVRRMAVLPRAWHRREAHRIYRDVLRSVNSVSPARPHTGSGVHGGNPSRHDDRLLPYESQTGMINVSFVGCGGMAAHYIDVYRSLDYVRLANTIDPGVPGASTEFADALRPEIDAVVISTPNHLHREQAVAAID